MTVRSTLRAFVEAGLVHTGVAALGRATRLRRALVLAYHNIVPDDCPPFGDRSLHLSRSQFARHLERLLTTHLIVPLHEVLMPAARGQRPRVAITFDDGYRGAVALGVAELVKRGVPATLFVVPGFLGRGPFWWDAVASGAQGGVDPGLRARALDELGGQDREVRRWAETHGPSLTGVPEWALVASEPELQAAARHPGITLASHTWSHPNLARLAPAALADELARPLAWLRGRFTSVIPWLSYPYGLASPAIERAAAAAGYAAAVGVGGDWFAPARVNRYAVPRLNVPAGLSANGFVLRTSGVTLRRA